MDETRVVVQQNLAVDRQRLANDVIAVCEPFAVAGGLIDLPGSRCPTDVVAHDGPLPLELHDDAVTVHDVLERLHGLMRLEACQGEVDGAVQTAAVVRHGKGAVALDAVDDAVGREVIEGIYQALFACVFGQVRRARIAAVPGFALDKAHSQRVVAVGGLQAVECEVGGDAVTMFGDPGHDSVLDDAVAGYGKPLVLHNDAAGLLLTAVTAT